MKHALLIAALLIAPVTFAQDEKVSVPKSLLTKEQLAQVTQEDMKAKVTSWSGMGREVGEAVNASMQAITTQSNNFAQTGVGKLTIALVVWKILGDQAVHLLGGFVEMVVLVPLWIWSFRKMCFTRSIKVGKGEWKEIVYDGSRYDVGPRAWHGIVGAAIVFVILATVFSY